MKAGNPTCPRCGGFMRYNKDKTGLKCGKCGLYRDLKREMINPRNLKSLYDPGRQKFGIKVDQQNFQEYQCTSCKTIFLREKKYKDLPCPFCDGKELEKSNKAEEVVKPFEMSPFVFPKSQVINAFQKWVKKGRFHPPILKSLKEPDRIQGALIPFWKVSAKTRSSWWLTSGIEMPKGGGGGGQRGGGQRGRGGRGGNQKGGNNPKGGGNQGEQGPSFHWEHIGGYYEYTYNDILVPVSKGVSEKLLNQIYPFEYKQTVFPDYQYFYGWAIEVYQVAEDIILESADKQMNEQLKRDIEKLLPGKEKHNLKISTEKGSPRFNHILLPVWIAIYHYKTNPINLL